jgi:hypothetical protein
MLWTIRLKNTPGVFLPNNASDPLHSRAEIFPQNRPDHFRCIYVKPQLSSAPHEDHERGEWWNKQNPVQIPRTSDLPPRN